MRLVINGRMGLVVVLTSLSSLLGLLSPILMDSIGIDVATSLNRAKSFLCRLNASTGIDAIGFLY